MISKRIDEDVLRAILEMGGEDLRAQLLDDLFRLEADIVAVSGVAASGGTSSRARMLRLLHEMRGIALTVGGCALAQACADAEADHITPLRQLAPLDVSSLVMESRAIREKIAALREHPA